MKFYLTLLIAALVGAASALHGFTFRDDDPPFYWYDGVSAIPEGTAFYAYESPPPNSPADTVTLKEIWNSATNELFYTTSDAEIASLHLLSGVIINTQGWQYGTNFINCFPAKGNDPNKLELYRFYNGNEHFYSTNLNEGLVAGFTHEGVACWQSN
ncbi:MAG: hypothetical protein M1829_003287 [Trizodia sp. TS-e1964]|nr:MAG: hypothetical protein M1829_003287 [Trizodia sp. TS-e1964]